jgi:hypothetical protein
VVVPLWLVRPAGGGTPPGPHQRGDGADVGLQLLRDEQKLPQLRLQAHQLLGLVPVERLLFADSQLVRFPAQLELQSVAVHEGVRPVQLGLDLLAVGHNRLDPLVAGETAPGRHVVVEVRDRALDPSKLFVQHLGRAAVQYSTVNDLH